MSAPSNFATANSAVEAGFDRTNALISSYLGSLSTAANALQSFQITLPQPAQLNALDTLLNQIASINAKISDPGAPNIPATADPTDSIADPVDPAYQAVPTVSVTGLPTITQPFTAPQFAGLSLPSVPGPLTAQAPGNAPATRSDAAVQKVVNAAPTVDASSIPVPTPRSITLPAAPAIAVIPFNSTLLATLPSLPDISVNYVELVYNDQLLTDVKGRLSTMLLGGTGLPIIIEAAIFDRARAREDLTARKAVQEAAEEFSSRGFDLPNGELSRRIDEARARNQDAVNTLERDLAIKVEEEALQNLRFSVTQGVALETVLMQHADEVAKRALDLALGTARLKVDYFNAQIAGFNAAVQKYATDAEVYRVRIDAERSKIENYRAQIEAQGLIQQLNESDIRLYTARVQALQEIVAVYTAQVQAVSTLVELDRTEIEAFRATVEAYTAQVQAKAAEYGAYDSQIRGEATKVSAYQGQVQAFAELVRAGQIGIEAQKVAVDAAVANNRNLVEQFTGRIESFKARVSSKAQLASIKQATFEGAARIYEAKIGLNEAQVQAETNRIQIAVGAATSKDAQAIQSVQVQLEAITRSAGIVEQQLESIAKIYSQLVAGALSAFNFGAQISSHTSGNLSLGESVGWNVSVDGGSDTSSVPIIS